MRILRALFLLTFLFTPAIVAAATGDRPVGDVILTVTGPSGEATEFDREGLESIGPVEIHTTTIWTDGPQVFTGVPLRTLLEAVGLSGEALRATAINDYSVEIPVSDAVEDGPIVAFLQNGSPMSVREKGPLWIVYPYDADRSYQSEVIYSRSIWQLNRLEVLP